MPSAPSSSSASQSLSVCTAPPSALIPLSGSGVPARGVLALRTPHSNPPFSPAGVPNPNEAKTGVRVPEAVCACACLGVLGR